MEKKDLASILISKENDYFRPTTNKDSEYYLFDTQIDAARKIIMQLACNYTRSNHVMLVARMQGGKTGAMCATVNIINKSRLDHNMAVNKFFFITGMNDCGLKTQTYDRVINQIENANVDNTYWSKRSKRNLSDNRYFVLKNSDLLEYEGSIDNSVIFIDECHYGSNEKNKLTLFMKKHGIDWKNRNDLISRNIYIVSISATPFDELVSDTANCKKGIELDVSKEYVGVSEYLDNDLIFEATKEDIAPHGLIFDYIEDAYDRMNDNNEKGAIIIRTRKFDVITDNKFVQDNFDVFEMWASGSKIEYATMNVMLDKILKMNAKRKACESMGVVLKDKPLLILIKGAFRAGITIPSQFKDIIYMLYDYSLNADTTAQALLGRMCGYRSNTSKITNTYFYINKKFADMYSNWENDFSNRENIPSNKTTMEWVSDSYRGDDVEFGSRSCGNFTVGLTEKEIEQIYSTVKGKKNRKKLVLSFLDDLLTKKGHSIKYDYLSEVLLSGKNHYALSSQKRRFDSFTSDLMVFPFRPHKIKEFQDDTKRDYLCKEDIGKKCISVVLDATIDNLGDEIKVGGNLRLLIYYVEVGQKRRTFNRKNQLKAHKNTFLG